MRFLPSAAALALLLLASYSSAATPLQAFLASSFEPGSAAQASALLVNGSFYLVYAGGNETYVLDASNGKAVEGIGALTALLEQDARNRASYEQKMSSAMSFAASVSAAKNASEAKCLQ